ncbi:MAG: hypothetical protein FD125_2569 [bacterium]|nr:MAG: hypothetical protein FD125_2569 [bacterium]
MRLRQKRTCPAGAVPGRLRTGVEKAWLRAGRGEKTRGEKTLFQALTARVASTPSACRAAAAMCSALRPAVAYMAAGLS